MDAGIDASIGDDKLTSKGLEYEDDGTLLEVETEVEAVCTGNDAAMDEVCGKITFM
jgi:hypothetical protein